MKFIERTKAPIETDKFFNNGAFNPYAYNYGMFQHNGNCTCYAFGRFSELLGKKSNLAPYNAEDWFDYNDGYKRGNDPKVGAVIVWAKGKVGNSSDGCGHVAIVERINSDKSIVVSESGWKSFLWRRRTIQYPYNASGYTLLGFIYSPNEYDVEIVNVSTTYTYTQFVKDVQKGTGAVVDGIAGKETISKTITISKSKNNKHSVVKAVQKYLISLGYDLGKYGADGIFGNDTDKAVKLYQKNNGCVVDGEITAKCKTWKKLLKLI